MIQPEGHKGSSHGWVRRHFDSVPGHRTINRGRVEGHERFYRDYFATLVYMKGFSEGDSE